MTWDPFATREHPARTRVINNPFFVLALPTTATRIENERQAQKWLALLEVKAQAAAEYATPFGLQPRTMDLVRQALHDLKDPSSRIMHEFWAQVGPITRSPPRARCDFGFRALRRTPR